MAPYLGGVGGGWDTLLGGPLLARIMRLITVPLTVAINHSCCWGLNTCRYASPTFLVQLQCHIHQIYPETDFGNDLFGFHTTPVLEGPSSR